MPTIVFYVSGHGFGHAARTIEVINALRARRPGARVIVCTTAARWLFERTVRARVASWSTPGTPAADPATVLYREVEVDTGVTQIDSLRMDEAGSVRKARAFMETFETRVAAEAEFLAREGAALVVADIPPLGVAAGAAAGVPAVALGNFTWDWIYSAYAGTDDVVRDMSRAYARADAALRLPMHGGFASFGEIVDLPFVARRSTRDPGDTRRVMGFSADRRLVLYSFGGYGLTTPDPGALARLDGYHVLVSGVTFDESRMYEAGLRYEDLVAAADVVVSKPGYGIIAECLANDAALLYTSRGHFIEYDVLVAAMPRFLRAAFIGHDDLFAGRWQEHLDAVLARTDPPDRPAIDGAARAAEWFDHLLRS